MLKKLLPLAALCLACNLPPIPIPTPPTPTPTAAAVTPTPPPVVTPTAAPTLTPGPPTPPSSLPWLTSCALPTPVPAPENCTHTSPGDQSPLRPAILYAEAQVKQLYPTMFSPIVIPLPQGPCPTGIQVLPADRNNFYWSVALQASLIPGAGVCAAFNGENVALKTSNSREDQFHVLRADGCYLDPNSLFVYHCEPATF